MSDGGLAPGGAREAFLQGGGEVGALVRAHDWSGSPLGPPAQWPQSLRSVVGLLLNSKFPMFVAWGEELGFLYNDAYAEILGAKHPAALGARFYDIWSEIWDDISPLVDAALAGQASYREDLRLIVRRGEQDEEAWFTFSYSPVRAEDGAVAGMFCAVHETTSTVLAEARLRDERQRLHDMFQQAPTFMAMLAGPEHRFELANPDYLKLVGGRPVLGLPLAEALHEAVEQGFVEILDRVYATGEPFAAQAMKYSFQAAPGAPPVDRYVDFVYQPLKDRLGRVRGIFVQGADVTDRARHEQALRDSEDKLKLMVLELNHRVKNNLATVQAIAMQTLRGDRSPEEMREAFLQRISALAAAHDILTREQWDGVTVSVIADAVLGALGPVGEQIRLSGPEIRVSSKAALALSMAFHELGTNALKYGALSTAAGRVEVDWRIAPQDRLQVDWRERNGPAVRPPSRRGFGSRLLERGLANELGGGIEMRFEPDGLRCHVSAQAWRDDAVA
jgi:two-component sensor histidine kinase